MNKQFITFLIMWCFYTGAICLTMDAVSLIIRLVNLLRGKK